MEVHFLNGPNLNLIGKREPEIYGSTDLLSHFKTMRAEYTGHNLHYFQSNHEGMLIDYLHDVGFNNCGIIFNAGAYTHTSIALADAIRAIPSPVVEVHISDIYKREKYRHHSYLKDVCIHTIAGKGISGYEEALKFLINYFQ